MRLLAVFFLLSLSSCLETKVKANNPQTTSLEEAEIPIAENIELNLTVDTPFTPTAVAKSLNTLNYSVDPPLPTGMRFDNKTCVISGTPSALYTRTRHTIKQFRSGSFVKQRSFYIVIHNKPLIQYLSNSIALTIGKNMTELSPSALSGSFLSITPSLPSGLTLDRTTMRISGTPTNTLSSQRFEIVVANSAGIRSSFFLTLTIVPEGVFQYAQSSYKFTLNTAISNLVPSRSDLRSFTVTPSLPAGLFVDSTGVIKGMPTALSSSPTRHILKALDSQGLQFSTELTLEVINKASISYTQGTYFLSVARQNQITPQINNTQRLEISPALPTGLIFSTQNGSISGKASTAHPNATFIVKAFNAANYPTETSITLTSEAPPTISYPQSLYRIIIGKENNITPSLSGNLVTISPALPTGLTIDTNTGAIRGQTSALQITPVQYTISASNRAGDNTNTTLSLEIYPELTIDYPSEGQRFVGINPIEVRGKCTPNYGISISSATPDFYSRHLMPGEAVSVTPQNTHIACSSNGTFIIYAKAKIDPFIPYVFGNKSIRLFSKTPTGGLLSQANTIRGIVDIEPNFDFEITNLIDGQVISKNTRVSGKCLSGSDVRIYATGFSHTVSCTNSEFFADIEVPASVGTLTELFLSIDTATPWSRKLTKSYRYLYKAPEGKTDSLIVYNLNYADAYSIAEYYRNKRNLPSTSLCGVHMPLSQYANAEEYDGMRREIINNCICSRLSPTDSECSFDNPVRAESLSKIGTFVLIKGMPTRLTFNAEDPSLDPHLARFLFSPDRDTKYQYDVANSPARYQIENKTLYAVGRIEALNTPGTLKLIDRTIEAERIGFQGNVIAAKDSYLSDIVQDIYTGERGNPVCIENRERRFPFENFLSWDSSKCRFTNNTVREGSGVIIPGLAQEFSFTRNTIIPIANNVGAYWGGAVHHAVDQCGFSCMFQRMLDWQVGASSCTKLCKDFSSEADRASCRSRSKDYFREINTDCVGVPLGAVGHVVRSYPVTSASGIYPHGWGSEEMGHIEKMSPQIKTEAGAKFLRFGDFSWFNKKNCKNNTGSVTTCIPNIPVMMRHFERLVINETQELSIRYKIRVSEGTTGRLYNWLYYYAGVTPAVNGTQMSGGGPLAETSSVYTELSNYAPQNGASPQWQTVYHSINRSNPTFDGTLDLKFVSQFHLSGVRGAFDVKDIEILVNGQNIMPPKYGQFNHEIETTSHGDWASEFIDRLGGVAWWGSNSHYLTGGGAYSDSAGILRRWTRGIPLGAAVNVGSQHITASGLLFGDPLYLPSYAFFSLSSGNPIDLDPRLTDSNNTLNPAYKFGPNNQAKRLNTLRVSAKHGEAASNSEWKIEICKNTDFPADCAEDEKWQQIDAGRGSYPQNKVITEDLLSLVSDRSRPERIILRISLKSPLNTYAYFGMGYLEYDPNL